MSYFERSYKLVYVFRLVWICSLKYASSGVVIPVGNPIIESSSTFDVIGNLFIIDRVQVPFNGTIFSITGYFLNSNPATLQVWRPVGDNPQWDLKLVHEVAFNPSVSRKVETILLHEMNDPECFVVAQGDVIGIIIKTIPSPVTYIQNFDDPNTLRKKFYELEDYPVPGDIVTVDTLNFPYQFSISISVDIGELGQNNGVNCSYFYKRAEEYQAMLPELTTTEAFNLTTASMRGDTGPTGPVGPSGPKGDNGDTGTVGADGMPGATGPMGPTGVAGVNGSKGEKGESGPKGESGNRPGSTGAPGAKGDKGDPGTTGPRGVAGATGVRGITGAKGDLGVAGATGLAGVRGPQGIQGGLGATGAPGGPGPAGPPGPMSDSSKALPQAGIRSGLGATGAPGGPVPAGPPGPMSDSSKALPQAGIRGGLGATGAPGGPVPAGPPGPMSDSSKALPQAGASSDNIQSDFGLLSDNVLIVLLVWQGVTTVALSICCGCYICRRKSKGFFTHKRVSSADAYIVSNINSVTTENITQHDGPSSSSGSARMQDKRKMETNLSWAFVKSAPKYKSNGMIGSTNKFYPQDYD